MKGRNAALPPPPKKGRKRTPLERRTHALERTRAKFDGRRFSFRNGRDCARMFQFFMKELGRPIPAAAAGTYSDGKGAKRAIRRLGYESLPDFIDAHLEQIPFASILPGDIVELPAAGALADLGSIAIWMGSGTAYMYHEHARGPVPAMLIEPPLRVWKSLP
jgi:hypothetical protein